MSSVFTYVFASVKVGLFIMSWMNTTILDSHLRKSEHKQYNKQIVFIKLMSC